MWFAATMWVSSQRWAPGCQRRKGWVGEHLLLLGGRLCLGVGGLGAGDERGPRARCRRRRRRRCRRGGTAELVRPAGGVTPRVGLGWKLAGGLVPCAGKAARETGCRKIYNGPLAVSWGNCCHFAAIPAGRCLAGGQPAGTLLFQWDQMHGAQAFAAVDSENLACLRRGGLFSQQKMVLSTHKSPRQIKFVSSRSYNSVG